MTLEFPNPSRNFDDTERGVRFVGYDGMISVPFLIENAALEGMGAVVNSEVSFLAAFDASRKSIYSVARKVYSNSRQSSYRIKVRDMP